MTARGFVMEGATSVALMTAQQSNLTGVAPTYSAVAASDTCLPDDRQVLIVRNGNASPDTCTVVTPGTGPGNIAIPDIPITVAATTGVQHIGPLGSSLADPTTGLITITHSVTATVTYALVRT